jgi:cyclic-di-AMP phosphodiesterase PgpH
LFLQFGLSAVLNLLAFPLIIFYERLFGFPTDYSLLELTNTNHPLLRELASKAPGTFQHSLQVAALAEDAVFQIGGNPLLVRAGALYHDIGKLPYPYYFIENQKQGINPHQDLPYEESARIIIGHIVKGVELAKKHRLPEYIIDFIRTHQGTKRTDFFYKMSLQENADINPLLFTYKGPLPFSKETTVLMMADAVEAASRSLKLITEETIDELVERIIENQIVDKQFVRSDITFKDIADIKKIFKKSFAKCVSCEDRISFVI